MTELSSWDSRLRGNPSESMLLQLDSRFHGNDGHFPTVMNNAA